MIFLVDFSPIKPDFGLFFWTLIIFGIFFFLLSKFAFKPIAQALKDRAAGIADALGSAETARLEVANMKAENEQILAQAREERMKMLKEAKEQATSIVNESKNTAKEEASKIIVNAKQEIENMKLAVITDVKNQAGTLALEIAEKVIRKELKGNAEQVAFVNTLVKEMNLN